MLFRSRSLCLARLLAREVLSLPSLCTSLTPFAGIHNAQRLFSASIDSLPVRTSSRWTCGVSIPSPAMIPRLTPPFSSGRSESQGASHTAYGARHVPQHYHRRTFDWGSSRARDAGARGRVGQDARGGGNHSSLISRVRRVV